MTATCRSWWRNCALEPDPEVLALDRAEDELGSLEPNIAQIRRLISSLELCHHKAERWIENIITAIGSGKTDKGLGTRAPGQLHPAEQVWLDACTALSAWCSGQPNTVAETGIDTLPASALLDSLGPPTALKQWQVRRVIEKIRSAIHWPQSLSDPSVRYQWILLSGAEYAAVYRDDCPEPYRAQADFWLTTVQTMIHDVVDGQETELSLGLAIDMLMPCHWNFFDNLQIVIEAIGGRLDARKPFAACGRNIGLVPIQRRMAVVCNTLQAFCGTAGTGKELDNNLLRLLGEATGTKQWLAASLDKTIRLQLNPPDELRRVSALAGPDWLAAR